MRGSSWFGRGRGYHLFEIVAKERNKNKKTPLNNISIKHW
jgi:hypothetical protein